MFRNIGFHTEVFTPLSLVLLVAGGILGYGARFILKILFKKTSGSAILAVKVIGLAIAAAGMILIFKK